MKYFDLKDVILEGDGRVKKLNEKGGMIDLDESLLDVVSGAGFFDDWPSEATNLDRCVNSACGDTSTNKSRCKNIENCAGSTNNAC